MNDLIELTDIIKQQKKSKIGETATKLNRIVPFLRYLGYNDMNPMEIQAEVSVFKDGSPLPKRVDYACGNGKEIQIFVEAKKSGKNLKSDMLQLKKYYDNADSIFLGVLTNGEDYFFYRDGEEEGVMDINPFYQIDIRLIDADDKKFLDKIRKEKLSKKIVKSIKKDPYLLEKELREKFKSFCS